MQKVRDQIKDEDRGVLDQLDDNSIKELIHLFNNDISYLNQTAHLSAVQIFSSLPAPTVLKQKIINSQYLKTSALDTQISNDLNSHCF